MSKPGRIAFLLSGTGSTLANLFEEIDGGRVPGEVVVVISDREGAEGLELGRARNIPVHVVSRKAYAGRERYGKALEEALRPYAPDLVVSGGFLTLYDVPPDLSGRIVNVHPSLLPAFGGKGCYGHHVHEMVLERGVRYTGCTVHFTTDDVDGGPIVDQAVVEVRPDDTAETLAARVQEAERALYPACIAAILAGDIKVRGGKLVRA